MQPQDLQDDREQGTLPKLKGALPELDVSRKDEETTITANESEHF